MEVWRGVQEGLNAVIVNPSVILGPGFWNDNSGLFRLVWEGLKFYTRGVNGYVDVNDVTRAMIMLMDQNRFNERYIVSSENITYQQLFVWMAKYLDKPAPRINIPPIMTQIAWRTEALRALFTGSLPDITREMAVTASQKYMYSNKKICTSTGFSFKPVEQSIREICEFFVKDHT